MRIENFADMISAGLPSSMIEAQTMECIVTSGKKLPYRTASRGRVGQGEEIFYRDSLLFSFFKKPN
jgi:hypothetical protein